MKFPLALLALAVFSAAVSGQDDAQLQDLMKATNTEMGVLRKIDAKTGPDAAASAEKLSAIYEKVTAFWTAKNVPDAVKISGEGKTAADSLVAAVKAGDSEKASAAFKTLGGTCRPCHEAHREKAADGSYKIK